ncbi:hypothetical protein IIA28_18580 [candidate division KSB1 bacterium]|nr:hypothetical protein [candidate division KSB1 bacterium]
MANVNIKKLLFLTVGLIFLMVFGIRLLDPALSAGQPENTDFGIDNTYFRLFQEFKELPQTNHNLKYRKSARVPVIQRDPFVRPDAHSSTNSLSGREKSFNQGDLELKGILWHNKFPSAVISGEVVQVGNMLGRFRVKRILKKQVILFSPEGKIVLHLPEEESG